LLDAVPPHSEPYGFSATPLILKQNSDKKLRALSRRLLALFPSPCRGKRRANPYRVKGRYSFRVLQERILPPGIFIRLENVTFQRGLGSFFPLRSEGKKKPPSPPSGRFYHSAELGIFIPIRPIVVIKQNYLFRVSICFINIKRYFRIMRRNPPLPQMVFFHPSAKRAALTPRHIAVHHINAEARGEERFKRQSREGKLSA
jgi:hypothetical protein